MELDPTRAKWRQVADDLVRRIESGELPRGARVPSVVQVAEEYGVAQATAQKALRALRDEGVTRTEPGMGSFVR